MQVPFVINTPMGTDIIWNLDHKNEQNFLWHVEFVLSQKFY